MSGEGEGIGRYLRDLAPEWLLGAVGSTLIAIDGLLCDTLVEMGIQGAAADMPGIGTPTAIPLIERDRRIRRGDWETIKQYAPRAAAWLDSHAKGGLEKSLAAEVGAFYTGTGARVRVVTNSGIWITREPNGEIWKASYPWDWDGHPERWARYWVIVYAPFPDDGTWGDHDSFWGDPDQTFGTSASASHCAKLKDVILTFAPGHTRCECVIIAYDPASFDPLSAPGAPGFPDGTWQNWSKNVGGVQVANRLETARYFEIE